MSLVDRLGLGSVPPTFSGTYVQRREAFVRGRVIDEFGDVVRLDVDGLHPQMAASGTLHSPVPMGVAADWVAWKLTPKGPDIWEGPIVGWWASGSTTPTASPFATVRIQARRSWYSGSLAITFTGGNHDVTRELDYDSPYFRTAEFEIDRVQGSARVTQIGTCDHPNHPPDLVCEQLTIVEAYSRAGIQVVRSPAQERTIPLSVDDPAGRWTKSELYDAMYTYWSHHHARSEWAVWLLFAGKYVYDSYLGFMFDDSGRYQRHGAAVFDADVPAQINTSGDQNPSAQIARNTFFAGVHETGHCFNLAHSWAKDQNAWLPPPMTFNEPYEFSFMNYPHNVGNDQKRTMAEFYGGFDYSFSYQELRFLRHAPESFVEMGGEAALSDHDLRASRAQSVDIWSVTLTVPRPHAVFEFLEPVLLTVRLTNASERPRVVDAALLEDPQDLAIWIRLPAGGLRRWRPYAQGCRFARPRVLQPGESVEGTFFPSAGVDGWALAEPGPYELNVAVHTAEGVVHAAPLALRIAHPASWDEELLAQTLFTGEVGRALAFGGTLAMSGAIAALEAAVDRLPRRAIATHARLALGLSRMERRRVLRAPARDGFDRVEPRVDDARRHLDAALLADHAGALRTLGETTYDRHIDQYAGWLERNGDAGAATRARAARQRGGQPR